MSLCINKSDATRRYDRLLLLVLVAGTLLLYYPALKAGFIWDDDAHFTGNDAVRRWWGIIDIWTSRSANYFPLVLTTGWGLHKLFGFNPVVFHAVTLLFHVVNAVLLVGILRRFAIPGAWMAAFLFAWHPIQVESVAWVSELKNTQSAFFLFLSLLALQESGFFSEATPRTNAQRWWRRLSIVLFALALLSKASVVMVPAALLAIVWWKRGVRRWWDIDGLFPYFLLSLLAAAWTVWEQKFSSGAQGFEWSHTLVQRFLLAGQVFWFYLGKLFWPHPLMFLYPPWMVNPANWLAWLPVTAAFAAGGLCWWKRSAWGTYPGVALFWFGVLLFPVMGFFNVYFMRYAWVADHFVYLPAISIFVVVGTAWSRIFDRQRVVAMGLALLMLASSVWLSRQHIRTFHDAETLWRSTLAVNPSAWLAHNNLGLILRGKGDSVGARRHYEQALEINPRHYEAMNNLGLLLQAEGRWDEALAWYDQALSLRPELYFAWFNRGNLMRDRGDDEQAYASYMKAGELGPRFEAAWINAAMLAETRGDSERAHTFYLQALKYKKLTEPQIGGFLYERALLASRRGQADLALDLLQYAEALIPHLADLHLLRGDILEKRGEYDAAVKSYRIALHRRPDWTAVIYQLARMLAAHPDVEKRRPQEAVSMLDSLMRSGGDRVVEIVDAYAIALASQGRFGDAMRMQQKAIQMEKDNGKKEAMTRRLLLYERGESYHLPIHLPTESQTELP